MAENVTINVQQDNDIVNIISSTVTEVIDINVYETTEEVTLNITEEIIQVNINKIISTLNPNLQQVTDNGSHTTNPITVENNTYYSVVEPSDVGTENKTTGAYSYLGGDGEIGIKTNLADGIIKTTDLTNNLTLEFPDKTGVKTIATIDDIPTISNLVPYTGATLDVDLGEKELITGKLWLYDAAGGPTEKGSLHYADEALHFENSDGETLMYIEPGFMQLHKTGAIQSNFFTTNLTQNRDHYLPDNSGTIALTSDITGTNSGTNTGDETATSIKSKLGITTLSGSNTGDQDLSNLVIKNNAITGATKTKITYDAKGLVTSGTDATTADIADSTNKRYVTDANLTTIGNQSGTNTGDETTATIKTKLGITTLSGSNTGDQDLSGYVPTTRTVNAKALSANVTLTTADIADSTGKRYQTENQNTFNDATSSIQTQINSKLNTASPSYTGLMTGVGATQVGTSVGIIDLSQTWNSPLSQPTAIKLNITNTNSNSNSRLIDLQIGGISQFYVTNFSVYANRFSAPEFRTVTDGTMYLGNQNITSQTKYVDIASGILSQTSGINSAVSISPIYNQVASAASNTDLKVNRTETSVGSGTQLLMDLQVGSSSRFSISTAGKIVIPATNTAAGTTGSQTINKPSGKVNAAAGTTSLVVTNSLITTSSIVMCQLGTNDATCVIKSVVEANGSFTINYTAPTAETVIKFKVIN